MQVYYMLMMLCKATALTRVVNAGSHEGLEAWKLLVEKHEPSPLTLSAGLLQELRTQSRRAATRSSRRTSASGNPYA